VLLGGHDVRQLTLASLRGALGKVRARLRSWARGRRAARSGRGWRGRFCEARARHRC
jgi:hypothetical protein